MNTNLQEFSLAYQRGVEVGRELAKREADEFAALAKATFETSVIASRLSTGMNADGTIPGLKPRSKGSAKPPRAARTKAAGPRAKGVKDVILALIASEAISPADIIARTGFKSTSVRATLMSLKKAGLAMSDDGLWVAAGHGDHGNSEAEARV